VTQHKLAEELLKSVSTMARDPFTDIVNKSVTIPIWFSVKSVVAPSIYL